LLVEDAVQGHVELEALVGAEEEVEERHEEQLFVKIEKDLQDYKEALRNGPLAPKHGDADEQHDEDPADDGETADHCELQLRGVPELEQVEGGIEAAEDVAQRVRRCRVLSEVQGLTVNRKAALQSTG